MEDSNENNSEEKSKEDIKRREFEQTQKLLIELTNELYDKIEEINKKNDESKMEETDKSKEEIQPKGEETKKNKAKIEFTDLSWYKTKLDSSKK